MNDFLLQYNRLITSCIEAFAAIVGLFVLKKYVNTPAKYFIYFLVYLLICDFIGNYVKYIDNDGLFGFLKGTKLVKNFWWSTLFWKIGAIIFFVFYYHKVIQTDLFKAIIKYSGYSFLVFSFTYITLHWEEYFIRFFPIISILGAVIIFLCTVFYFIEILQSERILTFYRSLNFYISFAVFIWWLIITPLVFYDIYNSHKDLYFIFLKWEIYLFANIFMYSTFTFALIWCRPQND
ncbi:hypothetical protein A8C32_02320 [Flavivirga aquatica]|uniref:Uncharacterized protein n=1 Tax=Flavivirga aquatica TaxID=1849968 RepID=A0A1E5TAF0_9FLAO|nr:hypothetical protein [Flavivirga aquatica]OEK08306.1 hypothetical protein A8C32_02320 [Flavivirga aquatica]